MNDLSRPRRPHGPRAYLLLIVICLVLGGLAGAASAILGDQPGPLGTAVTAALVTAAMAAGFTACLWWWRGIDEAAREAHKWAWWWGGSGGMSVGAVLLLTLMLRAEEQPISAQFGSTPADIFVSGMTCILLFQMAGYALAWAGWWLKHR
jgi:heme A synthase